MSLGQHSFDRFGLPRWLRDRMWDLERAFERARASGRAEDDTRLRIFFVLVLFSLGFLGLAVGATRATLFSDALNSGEAAVAIGGARADLVDRNGKMLAADLLHYGLYIDPREIWDQAETRRDLQATMPDLDPQRLERALRGSRRVFLIGALTPEERAKVNDLGLPGVTFEPEQHRTYPLGPTAAHIIGFSDAGGEGISGAEAAFNEDIRAAAGGQQPIPLSIDLRVQGALENELWKAVAEFRPKGAVGVVADVHTGEILGLASWPVFDPNRPGKSSIDAQTDRAANSIYEMGSTFKAFTVAIGLDTGVATPESTFDATHPFQMGYRTIHDYHATHAILTLVEVFQHSSNIGTARLAESIGPARLSDYFNRLGLTTPAKIELIETRRPLTPKVWNEDAVASTSFGHGINVTPLAVTRAMIALLNGGQSIPLTIHKLAPDAKVAGTQVVSQKTSMQMLSIMRANVTGGSGKSANIEGLFVGGKTGTGDKWDPAARAYSHTKQVSSFAAVFPTTGGPQTKRYFVLILLDEPQRGHLGVDPTGGIAAAPAAGRVIERIAPFLGLRRHATGTQMIPVEQPAEADVSEER
ncbi:penicillin-binding protein 2 [Phenylobacterium sp.]|uniref:peptidoglycan D,D-transpeptidase FtsI family protein n=1 Tax=Phenylobacterium sp. TaxID=1871053 RepID=UPI0025F4098D|nr:penicillin-binding protein 2 [Phenylobacterium sp.]